MGGKVPAPTQSPAQAEERLLVEAAQKDTARFADLYELHFEAVYGFVARRVGNREAAEDVTSDVFHKALAGLDRFEWRGAPFAAWLMRIAANAIADRFKKTGKEIAFDNPPEIPANPTTFDEAAHWARIFRMVDELPSDQRQVVVMRFAEEKSIAEIAVQIGRSQGAVKQLQFRGLAKLRTWLESTRSTKRKSSGRNG